MRGVELTMSLGLGAMKGVSALLTAADQINLCRDKIIEVGAQVCGWVINVLELF
jgi:hypothetical protein